MTRPLSPCAIVSTWGDVSHLLLAVDLGDHLVRMGWRVEMVGLDAVRAHVERSGFKFHRIAPLPSGMGWELLAHLQRCNRIEHRVGGRAEGAQESVRSGRRVAEITLVQAAEHRRDALIETFQRVGADLIIWDPTELAAPQAAKALGISHFGLNFLAQPAVGQGDWWCEFIDRWRMTVASTRLGDAVNAAIGDVVDFTPDWGVSGAPRWEGLRVAHVDVRPNESLFASPSSVALRPSDCLIVLSTAYRTEHRFIEAMIRGAQIAGMRAVVLAARSSGSPALDIADLVIERAPVSTLASRCGVVVTGAGSHSVVGLASGATPAVAVPVRVHSYWEVASAGSSGIAVLPADELVAATLAELISGAQPPVVSRRTDHLAFAEIARRLTGAVGQQ